MAGKKSRQNKPNNDGNSTDSCEENSKQSTTNPTSPTSDCQHIKKSIDLPKLRKLFKTNNLDTECKECTICPPITGDEEFEYDKTLWLCLKCGSQLCGRSKNQHALKHYNTPRSESHALTLNTTTHEIWCYCCDDEVKAKSRKNLLDCVEFVKKISQKPQALELNNGGDTPEINNIQEKILATYETTMCPLLSDIGLPSSSGPSISIKTTSPIPGMAKRVQTDKPIMPSLGLQMEIEKLPRVRGLTNLGNTCFFNAVLQCLAQTPYLLEVLKESSEAGEEFTLPGGDFEMCDKEKINLMPIEGKLQSWGGLTKALAESLEELQSGGGVFNPSKLFNKLTSKCPQFQGGDQHDSHELLRHLLESVRSEDLHRYQKVILNYLGYQTNDDVSDEMRYKCKLYGQQVTERILRPEQVFRGFLVSTLECQDCHNTSSRHENFLDISLPVSVEKPAPPMRRKTSPDSSPILGFASTGLSKHQIKKEKEKERKAKRAQKHHNKKNAITISISGTGENGEITTTNLNATSRTSSSSSDSDADVEDNLIDDNPKLSGSTNFDSNGNNLISPIGASSSEKRGDSPENPNKDSNDDENDSGIATSPSAAADGSTEQIPDAKNVVLALGISEQSATLLRQRSREGVTPNALQLELENLSLNGDMNNDILEAQKQAKAKLKQRCRTQSYSDWNSTMAPRYQCESGECSIQSCLNNFTALELMTGNNKVGCDECTERAHGKEGKTIYTNSTKQFLISSPPAVLILHLKRFQVGPRSMFRKLTRAVSFTTILEIAPFCGSKVKNLPNINRKQKKLLYALYGIVEHSGGMYGGHYTAFVKVRPKLDSKDPRWKFIPQGSKAELDQTDEQKATLDMLSAKEKAREQRIKANDSDDYSSSNSDNSSEDAESLEGAVGGSPTAEPVVEAPHGKWYFVSDSRVQEVSEDSALKAQAYLLFYERIY